MAYEVQIVISFGITLAVASVYLFLSHVKRISSPNKADPEGTLVKVNLNAALAEDEVARQRKATAKRSRACRQGDVAANEYSSPMTLVGSFCEGNSNSTTPSSSKAVSTHKFADVASMDCRHPKEQSTTPTVSCSTMILPSHVWAEAFMRHAEAKRKQLRGMVKRGERLAGWEAVWDRLPPPRRRRVLESVRGEVIHAVSEYVGQDENLFDAVCPELRTSALEEEHRAVTGFSRLVRRCVDGKLMEPRSRAFAAVQQALADAEAARNIPKDKSGPVRAFLGTFRKLCAYSFCIGAVEAVSSGRADGSAGPTIGSVCKALIKTGGSGILLWVFFHELNKMSAANVTEGEATAGLATDASAEGESLLGGDTEL